MKLPHILSAAFFSVLLLVASFPIFAHHAFPTFFDPREIVSVEGFLTGVRLINPHSYFRVQVTEPNGQTGDWVFESSPVASLSKAGWHSDSIPASSKVRMSGFAARNGRPIARWRSILVMARQLRMMSGLFSVRDSRQTGNGGHELRNWACSAKTFRVVALFWTQQRSIYFSANLRI